MKRHADRVARIEFDDALSPSIARLLDLLSTLRAVARSVGGADAVVESVFSSRGFRLCPTGPRTTVFHDPPSDCFFKILHRPPLTLRARAHSLISNRARQIRALSERLVDRGVRVPRVRASGTIRETGESLYAIDRAQGRSLYDVLIREQRALPTELYLKVIDAVAGLHRLGYWLGDAHLSHVFVHEGQVSGFIDIDGVRRNRPPRLSNLARDLAGLNHPGLPLGRAEKESLLEHYARRVGLRDEQGFRRLVADCSATRWRSVRPGPAAGPPGA